MPDATTQASAEKKGKFTPFAGCSIFIIVGLVALGMIGFTAWTYFQMKGTIEGFSEEKTKTIPVAATEGRETAQTALKSKLVAFRHSVEAGNPGTLALGADELNLAIATFPILKPHRGALRVTGISDGQAHADISFPVKSRLGSDEMRFINGSIAIEPEIVDGSPFPRVTMVRTSNGAEVPTEFRKFISETLLHPLRNDKELGPLFSRITSVEVKGNEILLATDPGELAATTKPPAKGPVIERFMKGFAIVALIFLALITGIIILSRRKAGKS